MKKITILLAASAVLASALLVSCNNGTKDYINVANESYDYRFNVTGTVETSITATGKNDDTTKDKVEISISSKSEFTGIGSTSWGESLVNESNYTGYDISYEGSYKYTQTTSTKVKDVSTGSNTYTSEGYSGQTLNLVKIDDAYYVKQSGKLVALAEDAIDGDFDDDFTLNFTVTETNVGNYYDRIKNARYSYTETTDPIEYADTVTTKYSLTFTRADN